MTSTTALRIATLLSLAAGGFSYWASILTSREAKRDLDSATTRVISNQDETRDIILERLNQLQDSEQDTLGKLFPYGYILFGMRRGGNLIHLPFQTGKAEISADWEAVKIRLDSSSKTIILSLPSFTFAVPGQNQTGAYQVEIQDWQSAYTLGVPVLIDALVVPNQEPRLYFEVVDDNPETAQVLLGLK